MISHEWLDMPIQPSLPPQNPTHLDLLFHLDALQRSAMQHDVETVHARLCELRNALVEHLGSETDEVEGLSAAAAGVVRSGHRRLLGQIGDLIGEVEDDAGRCNCLPGTMQLAKLLRRQARIESGLLDKGTAHPSLENS